MQKTIEQLENQILDCFEQHYIKKGKIDPQNIDYSSVFHYVAPEDPSDPTFQRKMAIQHFSALLHATIHRDSNRIKKIICNEMKYCDAKKDERIQIVKGALDAALSAALGFPVPIIIICEYVVRRKWLDPLCECES